ncbi:DsbC family protein [Iodobacter ciconiae]|uniref:Thiol:disulfide interchange protein n=1 Tax=Iodobacter ciconiae TaxID=2496266 RepID=A0A3S8ZT48_9NEIS|nr:DsbC family protein [Iodobacter ciconiae]AZN36639.1 DsbC family protein [Iodobacter ciconiae]
MIMKSISRVLIAAGFIALTACSASADNSTNQLKQKLAKQLPDREITSISTTPMKGIYEVVIGKRQIVYTDIKGEYILAGDMIDLAKKSSLTEQRTAELQKTDFSKLPLDQAIKDVRGDGSRVLVVFSDPDCPYCKRLERESLNGINNVTIYTFLMPLSIHPDAERKSKVIWCAADKHAAWSNFMLKDQMAEGAGTCENPIEKNMKLAESLGISGTPALIFKSGQIVSGAIPKEQIEQLLAAK